MKGLVLYPVARFRFFLSSEPRIRRLVGITQFLPLLVYHHCPCFLLFSPQPFTFSDFLKLPCSLQTPLIGPAK